VTNWAIIEIPVDDEVDGDGDDGNGELKESRVDL
jgi:hypothetical protein